MNTSFFQREKETATESRLILTQIPFCIYTHIQFLCRMGTVYSVLMSTHSITVQTVETSLAQSGAVNNADRYDVRTVRTT